MNFMVMSCNFHSEFFLTSLFVSPCLYINVSTPGYFKVYNHSKLRKHELIGEVDIALVSLDLRFKETFNVDLFVKKSEVTIRLL